MSAEWSEDEQRQLRERAQGRGEADPEYLAEQSKAPEPIPQRMDIEPSGRTLINMQRDRRSIT